MQHLLEHSVGFQNHIRSILDQHVLAVNGDNTAPVASSSVLFLVGQHRTVNGHSNRTPCLILNKRSQQVRQPGDLCFPGGGLSPRVDATFARILSLPGFPLAHWQTRTGYTRPKNVHRMAQLLATSLRESFEEMRLIPLGVRFLGPLPPQRLIMFDRLIYPMVAWVQYQNFFRVNGEVEKVVHIPIDALLDPDNYAFFRLIYPSTIPSGIDKTRQDFACFVHKQDGVTDILWGATYRMIMTFLSQVFKFTPPDIADLSRVDNPLSPNYFTNR